MVADSYGAEVDRGFVRRCVASAMGVALLGGVASACGTAVEPRPEAQTKTVAVSADPAGLLHPRSGSLAARAPDPLDWVANNQGVCVTLVRGVSPAAAVRRLTAGGARRFSSRSRAVNWSYGGSNYNRYWLGAGRIGKWTFVWEDNGFQCSLHRPAVRTSAHGRFTSVFWNVNVIEGFTYAIKGHIVRQFDPVYPGRHAGHGKPLPAEAGLPWRQHPERAMLRLQTRLTGQQVARPGWLRRPHVHFWGYYLD